MVILKTCMRSPGKTILGALGIFFITLLISLGISLISTQEAEIKDITLYVTLPSGTTLENTDILIAEAEKKLEGLDEKKDIVSQIYEEEAVLTITLIDDFKDVRNFSIPKIKNEVLEKLEELNPAEFSWDPPATGRFGGNSYDDDAFGRFLGIGAQREKVLIKGQDFYKMLNQAKDVKYSIFGDKS